MLFSVAPWFLFSYLGDETGGGPAALDLFVSLLRGDLDRIPPSDRPSYSAPQADHLLATRSSGSARRSARSSGDNADSSPADPPVVYRSYRSGASGGSVREVPCPVRRAGCLAEPYDSLPVVPTIVEGRRTNGFAGRTANRWSFLLAQMLNGVLACFEGWNHARRLPDDAFQALLLRWVFIPSSFASFQVVF